MPLLQLRQSQGLNLNFAHMMVARLVLCRSFGQLEPISRHLHYTGSSAQLLQFANRVSDFVRLAQRHSGQIKAAILSQSHEKLSKDIKLVSHRCNLE